MLLDPIALYFFTRNNRWNGRTELFKQFFGSVLRYRIFFLRLANSSLYRNIVVRNRRRFFVRHLQSNVRMVLQLTKPVEALFFDGFYKILNPKRLRIFKSWFVSETK